MKLMKYAIQYDPLFRSFPVVMSKDIYEGFNESLKLYDDRNIIAVWKIKDKKDFFEDQDPCNYCGDTLREQMKGCNEITCYRQHRKTQNSI